MICVNELSALKCNKKDILKDLCIILHPYAPHITEELWELLGYTSSISTSEWPVFNMEYLIENEFEYPVSFNGKMRFKIKLPLNLTKEEIENKVMEHDKTENYLKGSLPKKIIIVPKRIINIVM